MSVFLIGRWGGGPFSYTLETFILQQEALDYESFMKNPKLIRNLIGLWRRLVDDMPSLVWGFIGGSFSGIATALVLKWLGVK